jgi:antitoxin component of MazEF toxin-antitoxin module
MRVHKVINRVHEGTTYYRWVVSIPPKNIRELGWTDGQELETLVRGSSLWVQPALHPQAGRRSRQPEALEEEVQRKSLWRRRAGGGSP